MKYKETNPSVLVIGYGNELRGDDAAGWEAAKHIEPQLPAKLATVMTVHQLLPELAEPISRCDLVIFIDANAKLAPGLVRSEAVLPVRRTATAMGHHQGPGRLLAYARDVFGRAPKGMLFTIGGLSFDYGCQLSTPVQRALPTLIRQVMDVIRAHLRKTEHCNA